MGTQRVLSGILALMMAVGTGCGGAKVKRDVIDASGDEPRWAKASKQSWMDEDGGKVYVRARHEVRGDQRVDACFDLVRLDARENLLSEIATDVRGRIDNAQQSISENAEVVLSKARSSEFKGRVVGFKFPEQYFERYRLPGDSGASVERIECFVLAEISRDDYNRIKREVVEQIVEVDPRIKEAIARKQIDFFSASPNLRQPDQVPVTTSDTSSAEQ